MLWPSADHFDRKESEQQDVIVVGAGITGILIAQGLKKANIGFSIWEAKRSLDITRSGDWAVGLHWALPMLEEVLPRDLFARLQEAGTDPFQPTPDSSFVPILNSETGELLTKTKLPKTYRLSCKKLRALCSEGLNVQYGKRLKEVCISEDKRLVTVKFFDGSMVTGTALIGADGARSAIRNFLLGHEKAALSITPYIASRVQVQYAKAEQAIAVRQLHAFHAMGIHRKVLDVADPARPNSWTFQLTSSRVESASHDVSGLADNNDQLAALKAMAENFADPFRSAYRWISEDTVVRTEKVSYWEPIRWNNRKGLVTLAGDAAHPMTIHRGQGLNHAIADASSYVAALRGVKEEGVDLEDATDGYDVEVTARGGEEVKISMMNTDLVHHWDKLMQSDLMHKKGTKK
ncbi:hypothetical protein MMC28_000540 [Mycoblastus sanguinarius]|nr:hypothetical protein [Mycoblastus sanguinarius]